MFIIMIAVLLLPALVGVGSRRRTKRLSPADLMWARGEITANQHRLMKEVGW